MQYTIVRRPVMDGNWGVCGQEWFILQYNFLNIIILLSNISYVFILFILFVYLTTKNHKSNEYISYE